MEAFILNFPRLQNYSSLWLFVTNFTHKLFFLNQTLFLCYILSKHRITAIFTEILELSWHLHRRIISLRLLAVLILATCNVNPLFAAHFITQSYSNINGEHTDKAAKKG